MVEIAIIFPVLLIVLTGLVEFGFMLNDYLTVLDAARNAARFSADSNFTVSDSSVYCDGASGTTDFYTQTACLVCIELANEKPAINAGLDDSADETALRTTNTNWQVNGDFFNCPLDASQDDVIINAISVQSGSPAVAQMLTSGSGWELYGQGYTPKVDSAFVVSNMVTGSPDAGFLSVEVIYHYEHVLGLPWIGAFLGNPTALHIYTIMPLASGEPTSTPIP